MNPFYAILQYHIDVEFDIMFSCFEMRNPIYLCPYFASIVSSSRIYRNICLLSIYWYKSNCTLEIEACFWTYQKNGVIIYKFMWFNLILSFATEYILIRESSHCYFSRSITLLKNVDLFLLATYNATFDMHTWFADIFYYFSSKTMRCLHVIARDKRNLIFLDYKFYMFGANFITICLV